MRTSARFTACWAVGALVLWAGCGASQKASAEDAEKLPGDEPEVAAGLECWNPGTVRSQIERFVEAVTDPKSPDFVPRADRVAVLDNDGTMWVEKPVYVQLAFVFDRVRQLAPEHPEWKTTQPFKAVLDGDPDALERAGKEGVVQLLEATHTGMTTIAFAGIVEQWMRTARHPRFDRAYPELAYLPMLQLVDYLQSEGFTVFIVSGGDADFMRPWMEASYGIPAHQIVGTTLETELETRGGAPVLVRKPEIWLVNNRDGKPVGIHAFIGKRPILAVGNSDGDLQMLEWTTVGLSGRRMGMLIRHTDSEREYRYDSGAEEVLRASAERGWTVVDMKRDWRCMFGDGAELSSSR